MRWLLGDALGPAGSLEWLASGGQVVLAVVVALAAFALAWSTASRHPVHRRLRLGEAACWAGALLVLVAAAAGPTWVEEEGRVEPGKLVVLVDGSASMGVVEDGEARSEGVAEILEAVDRAGDGRVEVFTFDEDLRSGLPTSYEGRGTDLGVALDAIADRHRSRACAGGRYPADGRRHDEPKRARPPGKFAGFAPPGPRKYRCFYKACGDFAGSEIKLAVPAGKLSGPAGKLASPAGKFAGFGTPRLRPV